MGKKYKLIKEYPNSPKLGSIIVDTNPNNGARDCWFSDNWGKSGSKAFFIPRSTNPEKHPEFWEEIIEKPIFITEDGVCVFKPGNFFIVDIDTTQDGGNYLCWIVEKLFIKDKGCLPISSCVKIFSTEKAAKDWIDLNKPKYSLKNIENAVRSFGYGPFAFSDLVKELNK